MDMAVGVIVGGAFTAIVTSLNQDILTPVLAIFGGTDFSNLYVKLEVQCGHLVASIAISLLQNGHFFCTVILSQQSSIS